MWTHSKNRSGDMRVSVVVVRTQFGLFLFWGDPVCIDDLKNGRMHSSTLLSQYSDIPVTPLPLNTVTFLWLLHPFLYQYCDIPVTHPPSCLNTVTSGACIVISYIVFSRLVDPWWCAWSTKAATLIDNAIQIKWHG